jgi:hypothetical protein
MGHTLLFLVMHTRTICDNKPNTAILQKPNFPFPISGKFQKIAQHIKMQQKSLATAKYLSLQEMPFPK